MDVKWKSLFGFFNYTCLHYWQLKPHFSGKMRFLHWANFALPIWQLLHVNTDVSISFVSVIYVFVLTDIRSDLKSLKRCITFSLTKKKKKITGTKLAYSKHIINDNLCWNINSVAIWRSRGKSSKLIWLKKENDQQKEKLLLNGGFVPYPRAKLLEKNFGKQPTIPVILFHYSQGDFPAVVGCFVFSVPVKDQQEKKR